MQKHPKRRRIRLTDEEKDALVERWSRSGQSAQEFALKSGVGMSSLTKWGRQFGGKRTKAVVRKRRNVFMPVRVRGSAEDGVVEIQGLHGFTIKVDGRTSEAALQRALRAIAQCG